MDNSLVKLTVQGVWTDASPNAESQVVLLQDEAKTSVLPIWVGTAEGTAIRMALEGIAPPRPLSHDLLRVNDHDMIAGIKMGCEGRFVFAPQHKGHTGRHPPKGLAVGIYKIPFTHNVGWFG